MQDETGAMERVDPVLNFLLTLWELNDAIDRTSVRTESALGLTAQDHFVIRVLGSLRHATPAQLEECSHLDHGRLTATIARLEAGELVARNRDVRNGRGVSLYLTAAGEELNASTRSSFEHAVKQLIDRVGQPT